MVFEVELLYDEVWHDQLLMHGMRRHKLFGVIARTSASPMRRATLCLPAGKPRALSFIRIRRLP
jgi:hypothetical protein